MQHKRATLVLLAALFAPVAPSHASMDDMFGMMFRMMLTMMNVMSDSMLDNDNWGNNWGNNNWLNNWSNGLGGLNSFNLGISAFPAMSGLWSPWNSLGGSPLNSVGWSPWSGMGFPWTSPWSSLGTTPWSSLGTTPWSNGWSNPWGSNWANPWSNYTAGNPWSDGWGNPFSGGYPGSYYPGTAGPAWGHSGYPAGYGGYAPGDYTGRSLLDGRWYGSSGEVLEIRGNRFQLRQGKVGLNGMVEIRDNVVNMYSPQTNTLTRYTFVRNQSGLLLNGFNGEVLQFTNNPVNGAVYTF